jgi:tRNA G37 N-methylase Trm5
MIKRAIKGYDIIGNIAILKFEEKTSLKDKKEEASKFLLSHKNITTILEKTEKIKGKLRTYKTRYILGKKTRETIHKENNCLFKLDVEKCYFSPRLSNERLEISEKIKKLKKKKEILVLFAGVAPFSIIIAKNNIWSNVYSIELNKIASKYAEENVKLNKLKNIQIIQGDVKKLDSITKKEKLPKKYDIIVMPRAQLKETFLKEALKVAKKGTVIYYYDFCMEKEICERVKEIQKEIKAYKKKISVPKIKNAGDIAPYKFRYLIEFEIK